MNEKEPSSCWRGVLITTLLATLFAFWSTSTSRRMPALRWLER